ncbi:MAG: PAS domain-containing protein [Gammaproteobacteria bacterium]
MAEFSMPPDWPEDLAYALGLGAHWVWQLDLREHQCWVMPCAHPGMAAPAAPRTLALSEAWALVHPEDRATVRQTVDECLASGKVVEVQHRLTPSADEPVRWVHQYARPLRNEDGTARALVGTARDVTAGIATIHELESRLAACRLQLREFGHRIQNNFAIIRAVLELHRPEADAQRGNELLSDLIGRVESLTELSRGFLGNADQAPRSVSLELQKLLDRARGALLLPGDELIGRIEAALPPLPGNRFTHLMLILNELLTNAAKHRRDWSRTLRVSVSARLRDAVLEIEVTDDGGGTLDFDSGVAPGLGCRLVTICCDQLGASLERRGHERGITALLRVPVGAAANE